MRFKKNGFHLFILNQQATTSKKKRKRRDDTDDVNEAESKRLRIVDDDDVGFERILNPAKTDDGYVFIFERLTEEHRS